MAYTFEYNAPQAVSNENNGPSLNDQMDCQHSEVSI